MFLKKKRILALISILFLFLIQMFIFGEKGILFKRKLDGEIKILENKLEEIEDSNKRLKNNLENLDKNPELIKKEAQNLLILGKNEFILRFTYPSRN